MKPWKQASLILATALALGAGAAQARDHGRWGGHDHDRAGAIDDRLATLKTRLKITAAQEPAWNSYASTLKQQAADMTALHDGAKAAATVPERLDQRSQMMKKRAEGFDKVAAATKQLYAALTPEQRALADQRLGRGFRDHGDHGDHGERGDRGHRHR